MARKKVKVKTRESKKNVNKLLESGYIPAVAYDQKANSTNIKIDRATAEKLAYSATPSTLYDLEIDGKESSIALIKEVQKNIRTGNIHHLSFMILDPKTKLDIPVEIVPSGESPAVRNSIGVLIFVHDSLELRGLPEQIPAKIEADVNELEEIGDKITVSDIDIPEELEFVHKEDQELTLATIRPFQKVIEVEEETAEVEGEDEEGLAGEVIEGEDGELIEEGEELEEGEGEEAPAGEETPEE
jgi:large subunit ribosomal protein L25